MMRQEPRSAALPFSQWLADSVTLFVKALPSITPLVLLLWIPANLWLEYMTYTHWTGDDLRTTLQPMQWSMRISTIFGPIVTAAIIFVLARQSDPETASSTSFGAALGAGLTAWGRLFMAHLLAGLLIVGSALLLVIPGIIVAVRLALVDPLVTLEKIGLQASLQRSWDMTRATA